MRDREAVGETLWLRSARLVAETKQTDAQTQTNYQAFCYSSPKKVTFQYYREVLQSIIQKYRKTMAQSVSDKVVQTDQELEPPVKLALQRLEANAIPLHQLVALTTNLQFY